VKATLGGDPRVVGGAAYGLARLGSTDEPAVSALDVTMSTNRGPEIRQAVVRAIGAARVVAPQLVPRIASLLADSDDGVVIETLKALRRLGSPVVRELKAQLVGLATDGKNAEVRCLSADLLSQ
jgi:hypothetical protein